MGLTDPGRIIVEGFSFYVQTCAGVVSKLDQAEQYVNSHPEAWALCGKPPADLGSKMLRRSFQMIGRDVRNA